MDLEKIDELLEEFVEHRVAIKLMIKDLEEIKKNVDKVIPTRLDARHIRFFEEKVKSVTALFNSLLEMRKEIARCVKEEIEIRRKIDKGDKEWDIDEMFDVRDFADKVTEFKDESRKLRKKIIDKVPTDFDDIEIPGITDKIENSEQGEKVT
jgi:hypothetical protein